MQQKKTTPDEWAAANRTYPPHAGVPGPRDPFLTPYAVPFGRAIAARQHKWVVMVMGGQMGKTDTLLDVIGRQFDQDPRPTLYVGPTQKFINEQFEPRLQQLLAEAPVLSKKLNKRREVKTRKLIAGVPLRLAHAGSPTALKSDPASLALTDEADDLMANVKGQGDPIALVDVRGATHADFVHAIVSTPSEGPSDVRTDDESGLEFWQEQDPADIGSKIWTMWQEGTMAHWAWPCPHCEEYFIPRFSLLKWPKNSTPAEARRSAYLECPRCGGVIEEENKADMNARGVYVSPGQSVSKKGVVTGDPPDSAILSMWVSGLCSPFASFGERAETFLKAVASGDEETKRVVINGGFGELYAPSGGQCPEWQEVQRCVVPTNAPGKVPSGTIFLTAGIDVQKDRLPYVIRAWGYRQESWLVEHGEIWGDTSEDPVWIDLAELLEQPIDGHRIRRAFVDAGFRPGKKDLVPDHKVYEFARQNKRLVFATRGYDQRSTPLSVSRLDVNPKGAKSKFGLDFVRLDTDYLKSWVHSRVRWPEDQPGGWHLHNEVDEEYCRQIVSEARMRKPSGAGVTWVLRTPNNHFLDCEALAYGAAFMLGIQRRVQPRERAKQPTEANKPAASPSPGGRGRRLNEGSARLAALNRM